MAEARQVKNRIVQAVLRECQKLKEKDDLTDELEHVRDIKNKKERLIKSVALASEASRRTINIEPYPVQILASIKMYQGHVIEMKTGEGKTFVSPMTAFAKVLDGQKVHVLTVNDYLVERDYTLLLPVYEMLGLSVGYITTETSIEERKKAKELCFQFNNTHPSDDEKQKEIMKQLLGKTDDNFCIIGPFWCDYGYNIEIGKNFFANHNLVILDCAKVTFGDNVFIAPNCGFYTAGHPIDYERRNKGLEYAYSIKVGNNVWIGGGVQVMPGVTIGNNVVIGGGSVVVKDIPSDSVAVGNPCKVIRKITEEDKKKCWDKL